MLGPKRNLYISKATAPSLANLPVQSQYNFSLGGVVRQGTVFVPVPLYRKNPYDVDKQMGRSTKPHAPTTVIKPFEENPKNRSRKKRSISQKSKTKIQSGAGKVSSQGILKKNIEENKKTNIENNRKKDELYFNEMAADYSESSEGDNENSENSEKEEEILSTEEASNQRGKGSNPAQNITNKKMSERRGKKDITNKMEKEPAEEKNGLGPHRKKMVEDKEDNNKDKQSEQMTEGEDEGTTSNEDLSCSESDNSDEVVEEDIEQSENEGDMKSSDDEDLNEIPAKKSKPQKQHLNQTGDGQNIENDDNMTLDIFNHPLKVPYGILTIIFPIFYFQISTVDLRTLKKRGKGIKGLKKKKNFQRGGFKLVP